MGPLYKVPRFKKQKMITDKKLQETLDFLTLKIDSIRGSLDLDKIFQTMGEEFKKINISTITSVIDYKKENIVVRHISFREGEITDFSLKELSEFKIKILKKYTKAIAEKRAIFCKNRINYLRKKVSPLKSYLKNTEEGNSIIVPLLLKGETIGFVELFSPKIKENHTQPIESFFQKLVINIANTILFHEVKRSEKKYRELFEKAQEGFLILNGRKKKFIDANKKLCEISDYTRDEILQINYLQLFAAKERDKINNYVKRRLAGQFGTLESPMKYETIILTKKGKKRFVEISIIQIINKEEWFGIVKDITEQKKAEQALRESEEKFRSLTETTSDWVWEVDKNAIYTYTNPKIKKLLGYEPEEIIGKSPFDLMPPQEVNEAKKFFFKKAEQKKIISRFENINIHKNGKSVVLETNGTPFFDDNNNLLGYRGIDRDITNRKKTEQILKESEKKYRKLVDNADDAVITINQKGYITFANNAFFKLTKYSKSILPKLHFSHILHPDDSDTMAKRFQRRIGGKKISNTFQFRIITKNGDTKYINYSGTPIKKGGQIIGVQGIGRDNTKEVEMQHNIERAKKHYEQVIDAIQDSICVIDQDFKIISCNKSFARKISIPIRKVKGQNYKKVILLFENNLFKDYCSKKNYNKTCNIDQVFKSSKLISFIKTNKNSKQLDQHHKISIFPVKNKEGSVYQAAITIRDITERKNAEDEIKRLSEFNKKILNNAPVSIMTIDKKGVVTSVNKFFYTISGETDFVGKNIYKSPFFLRESLVENYKRTLKEGRSFTKANCETKNIKGEIKFLNIIAAPIKNEKGEIDGAISMAVDNTEAVLVKDKIDKLNKELEKKVVQRTWQLDQLNKELSKVLDLKSKFISDASHELRTPLTIIKGNFDLAIREAKKIKNEIPETFSLVNKEIEQMSSILTDLTMLTNADSDSENFIYEKINLESLLGDVVKSINILAKQKNIKIKYRKNSKINIKGDETKLEKLFLNITRNAIKYTPQNGWVKIWLEKGENEARILIEDNGIGIPPKDLPYIFERFYRVDKSRSRKEGGTGLGLAIAKWVAEAHYGYISVESAFKKGSKFTIHLPYNYSKQKKNKTLL